MLQISLLQHMTVKPLDERKYSRMDRVKFFKGCIPQILLGPFLDTLPYLADGVISRSYFELKIL